MIEWYKKVVFKNYANFNGRARRSEFWNFFLVNTLISFGISFVFGLILPEIIALSYIYSLAVLIPSIAVGVRRMHDAGKSGWYFLIPVYNLILACKEGWEGPNQYGSDPKNDKMNQIENE